MNVLIHIEKDVKVDHYREDEVHFIWGKVEVDVLGFMLLKEP